MLGYGLGNYYYRALTMFRRIHEYFVAFKWHIKQFSEEINYKSFGNIFFKKETWFDPFGTLHCSQSHRNEMSIMQSNALDTHLELDGFEEDEEGWAGVVLHVVVHGQCQPVCQHLLYDWLSPPQHELRMLGRQWFLN